MALLAWVFRWPPESVYALEAEDMEYWAARLKDIEKAMQKAKNGL